MSSKDPRRLLIACALCLPLAAGCLGVAPSSTSTPSAVPAGPDAWNWTDDSFHAIGNHPGGMVLAVRNGTSITVHIERTLPDSPNSTAWVCTEMQTAKPTYDHPSAGQLSIESVGCTWFLSDGSTEVTVQKGPVEIEETVARHERGTVTVERNKETYRGNLTWGRVAFERFLWAFDETPAGTASVEVSWEDAVLREVSVGDRTDTTTYTQEDFEAETVVRADAAGQSRYRTSDATLETPLLGDLPWTHFWGFPPGESGDFGTWGSIESPNGSVTPLDGIFAHGATNRSGTWTVRMNGTEGDGYDGPRFAAVEYEQLGFSWRDYP